MLALACTTPPSSDVSVALERGPREQGAGATLALPEWAGAVDRVFAEWDRPDSPGCALAVVRQGRIVHARGFGSAHLEHGLPITTRTVFDIGSTSKQFTAACIGLLEQDGVLTADDDVRKWIPELRDQGTPITLRMLLHHTSGLRDYCTLFSLAGQATENYTTKEQALALVTRQKELNFTPGTEYLYSNTGYFLLSIVVERASGKTLPEFARERIFEPLGMRSTHIHDDHRLIVKDRAQAYSPREGGGIGIDMSDFEQTGDGSVMTTVEDLALWDANFTTQRIGGARLQEFLHAPGRLADGKVLDYAAGLIVTSWRGARRVSHGGAWAGYRAELVRFPEEETSVIVLCNLASMNPTRLAASVAEIVLAGALGPAPVVPVPSAARGEGQPEPPPSVDPTPFAGLYHSQELDVTYELAAREGKLYLGEVGLPTEELPALGADRFGAGNFELVFERDASNRPVRARLSAGRVRNLLFERTR